MNARTRAGGNYGRHRGAHVTRFRLLFCPQAPEITHNSDVCTKASTIDERDRGGRGYHVLAIAALAPSGFEPRVPVPAGRSAGSRFSLPEVLCVRNNFGCFGDSKPAGAGRGQALPISSLRHHIHEKASKKCSLLNRHKRNFLPVSVLNQIRVWI